MLFIANIKRAGTKDVFMLHVLPTALIFLAFLGVSIWSWQSTRLRVGEEKNKIVSQNLDDLQKSVSNRVDDYDRLLQAGSGLFRASENVDRQEWANFQKSFKISERYPGLLGISFAPKVRASQLNQHEQDVRKEGYPTYRVHPRTNNGFFVPILYTVNYIKPGQENKVPSLGYDIYTEKIRKDALDRAIQSGESSLSDKLFFLQPATKEDEGKPAVIIYQPFYSRRVSVTAPAAQKAKHLIGFGYAPFYIEDLFDSIKEEPKEQEIGFRVYNERVNKNNLMYENEDYKEIGQEARSEQFRLSVKDKVWVVNYKVKKDILATPAYRDPANTLVGGVIFSALIAGLVFTLLRNRTRMLEYGEERKLQQAKDDLLSIASHQLRTPATGVKQYIGMLKDGFAGKLSTKQQKLLSEAYRSNERQLGIIDDILHVARLDAGRVDLNFSKVKVRDLIEEILRDRSSDFRSRQQQIFTSYPKRTSFAWADKRYLQMALDNLITNASKYSPEGSKIKIIIRSRRQFTQISVADNGVGISEEDQKQLFKKFSRVYNTLSRQTAGTGLGLYITKQIVDLHHGDIYLESEPKKGTAFHVSIPKKPPVGDS